VSSRWARRSFFVWRYRRLFDVAGIWSGMRLDTRTPYDSSCSIFAGLFVISRIECHSKDP